jgi:electron transfer flavoprotein alpha subunit
MILTLVETDLEGAAIEVSLEALSFARDISAAGNGVPVDAVVFGDLSDDLRGELAAYGVRTIHHVVGDDVAAYSGAGWASAIQQVRDAAGSVVVMAAGTDRGTELMAHVATRSGAAMAANVLSFSGLAPFVVTRQVVGGSAMEEMNLHQRPAVFTVAGHAVEAKPADTEGAGEVVEHTPTIAPEDLVARVQSVAEVEADDESGALTSAKVVVGAGRGVGGPDKFDDVTELADLLHGAIGVSRVVTSAGWRPHHEQVGQTGSRISPDLYIPCGISGAIQHWAGCSSAKTILAINSDAEAPMVTRATYAVIGDLHEILPAINEEIRKRGYGS